MCTIGQCIGGQRIGGRRVGGRRIGGNHLSSLVINVSFLISLIVCQLDLLNADIMVVLPPSLMVFFYFDKNHRMETIFFRRLHTQPPVLVNLERGKKPFPTANPLCPCPHCSW